jgi:hypothetical protein
MYILSHADWKHTAKVCMARLLDKAKHLLCYFECDRAAATLPLGRSSIPDAQAACIKKNHNFSLHFTVQSDVLVDRTEGIAEPETLPTNELTTGQCCYVSRHQSATSQAASNMPATCPLLRWLRLALRNLYCGPGPQEEQDGRHAPPFSHFKLLLRTNKV